ncbi:hypothetical protein [Halorussus amylolyticus]|uniref:hypothetical protein n=1 Tax=Halorussus amylolyticus TaxID=1126242 RepID=UPI001EE3E3FB|nr:hypothetical protein [Halorussus amylolyticus]
MQTMRITFLVFGLLVSSSTLPRARQFINVFTIAGVVALLLTILLGLLTYSASDPDFGAGPNYLLDVRRGSYDEAEWFAVLVHGYENWIREMEELNDGNARLLTYTQSFLGGGITLTAFGVLVEVL